MHLPVLLGLSRTLRRAEGFTLRATKQCARGDGVGGWRRTGSIQAILGARGPPVGIDIKRANNTRRETNKQHRQTDTQTDRQTDSVASCHRTSTSLIRDSATGRGASGCCRVLWIYRGLSWVRGGIDPWNSVGGGGWGLGDSGGTGVGGRGGGRVGSGEFLFFLIRQVMKLRFQGAAEAQVNLLAPERYILPGIAYTDKDTSMRIPLFFSRVC